VKKSSKARVDGIDEVQDHHWKILLFLEQEIDKSAR
jgi:hypothetical protein